MKIKSILILILILLAISPILNAQITRLQQRSSGEEDSESSGSPEAMKEQSDLSPDTARIIWFTPDLSGAYTQHNLQARLHNFQLYTPQLQSEEFYINLGNTGSAARQLTFSPAIRENFRFLPSGFEIYRYELADIKFFIPEKPYSEINYMMGKSKEQQLLFTHSQQVIKGLTLGLHARYANSPGLYQRQRTYYASGYFTASFSTSDKRYGVLGAYLTDRYRNYENGGISYDSVFTENTEDNRKTIAVNLYEAINRDKTSGVLLQQHFNLQKPGTGRDSTMSKGGTKFRAGRLTHTLKYSRVTTGYEDNDTYTNTRNGFYPSTYGDSTSTLDSTFHIHLENNFIYSNLEPDTSARDFPFQYSFGIRYSIDRFGFDGITAPVNQNLLPYQFSKTKFYSTQGDEYSYSQWMPFGTLKGIIARKSYFLVRGRLSLGGFNAGDHELNAGIYQYFGARKNAKIFINAGRVQQHPDYLFYHFSSNHFRWENSPDNQEIIRGEAGIDILGYRISLVHNRITNFCWLDEQILPRQLSSVLSVTRADFSKVFTPGRWIIDSRFTLQQISDTSVLQLPQLIARGSVSYNMLLFKKVLFAEAGIHCNYFSNYYADAYMPELRSFYRQNQLKTGNYPYLDVFLNMKIKRARIFIVYEHINAKLTGFNYFLLPHNPAADASLKAGVSWMFYD